MSEHEGQAQPASNAEPFTVMAGKIVANMHNGFAGAFVIVPPGGEPKDMLILDSKANPAIFWSTLKTMVDIALAEIEAEQRQGQGGFGMRR